LQNKTSSEAKKVTDQEEISRGGDAKRLLENPIFQEAFEKVETSIIQSMRNSAFGDTSTHNHLVIALQLLHGIRKNIEDIATTGKMAELATKDGIVTRFRAAAGF
jgi:hypothetical protein